MKWISIVIAACGLTSDPKDQRAGTIAMFGATPSRNMANLVDKNIPSEWSIEKGGQKNIKWSAKLGDKAYGGPIVSGGKVFVATNRKLPYERTNREDHGVVACFRESDGKLLWQAVHDPLPGDIVKD